MQFTPPRYSVVVPFKNAHFRGKNASDVRIRVLSMWNIQNARKDAAASVVKEYSAMAAWSDFGIQLIHERTAIGMIRRACQTVDEMPGCPPDREPEYAMLFMSDEDVTRKLTEDEFHTLWGLVLSVQHPFMSVEEESDEETERS